MMLKHQISGALLALITLLSPVAVRAQASADAQLCRSQLELLISGNKLTTAEIAVFEAQCHCLEEQAQADAGEQDRQEQCAQER